MLKCSFLHVLIYKNRLKQFDTIFQKQKFPSFIKRQPRSIEYNLNYMKAIELYIIFHYYTILFEPILQKETYHLINELFKCLTRMMIGIKRTELNALNKKWNYLLDKLQNSNFFGETNCTRNFHIMKHLPLMVKYHGPLSLNSLFMFKAFNSHLTKTFVVHNCFNTSLSFFSCKQIADIYTEKMERLSCNGFLISKNDPLIKYESKYQFVNYQMEVYYIEQVKEHSYLLRKHNQYIESESLDQFLPAFTVKKQNSQVLYKPIIPFTFMFL